MDANFKSDIGFASKIVPIAHNNYKDRDDSHSDWYNSENKW